MEISENRSDVFFKFSQPFEIHDYSEVLRRMDMHRVDLAEKRMRGESSAAAASASGGESADSASSAADDAARLKGVVPEHLVPFVPPCVFGRKRPEGTSFFPEWYP